MTKILAIGIATLDIINRVENYPSEDSEVRAIKQQICRGGNATNTLVVLSQLGHQCHWGGILVDEPDTVLIKQDLDYYNINTQSCLQLNSGKMPTSYITSSQQTGSRSIVHYRDLPEFSFDDFLKIDLSHYDWVHFEGRNIKHTEKMLQYLRLNHPEIPCSLEIEKHRSNIEQLFQLPTHIMFSKHYASAKQYQCADDLLSNVILGENIIASCTWGKQGAWIKDIQGNLYHQAIFQPKQTIDTLGAGDTFNAGLIDAFIYNQPIQQALEQASKLAGQKCGQQGFANLVRTL